MNTSALLKKVRQIEIKTKGLSNHIFAGEYHTFLKEGVWLFLKLENMNQVMI